MKEMQREVVTEEKDRMTTHVDDMLTPPKKEFCELLDGATRWWFTNTLFIPMRTGKLTYFTCGDFSRVFKA